MMKDAAMLDCGTTVRSENAPLFLPFLMTAVLERACVVLQRLCCPFETLSQIGDAIFLPGYSHSLWPVVIDYEFDNGRKKLRGFE